MEPTNLENPRPWYKGACHPLIDPHKGFPTACSGIYKIKKTRTNKLFGIIWAFSSYFRANLPTMDARNYTARYSKILPYIYLLIKTLLRENKFNFKSLKAFPLWELPF